MSDRAIAKVQVRCALNDRRAGVLVVGHGTRNVAGTEQLMSLAEQIQSRLVDVPVQGCFLELAEPTIETGVSLLRDRGCSGLFVIPVLLFTAAHAKSDIPDAVAMASQMRELQVLGQTPSLGTHPLVLELSATRFRQVMSSEPRVCSEGNCAAACNPIRRCELVQQDSRTCELHRWSKGREDRFSKGLEVGLAMVGRGTSEESAIRHMKELTRLRSEITPVTWSQTGFFAGGDMTVDGLLDQAEASKSDVIVVQPHLLFEGELMDKLREKVRQRRESKSEKTWWMAGSLGADPQLAGVFVGLLEEIVLKS